MFWLQNCLRHPHAWGTSPLARNRKLTRHVSPSLTTRIQTLSRLYSSHVSGTVDEMNLPSCVNSFSTHTVDYYFIGAVHGSKESIRDIKSTICKVKPDLMILEMDKTRRYGTEVSFWKRIKNVWEDIREGNFIRAFLHMYEMKLLAHRDDLVDMKAAEEAARKVSSPLIVYADRPSLVTLERWLRRIDSSDCRKFMARTILFRETDVQNSKGKTGVLVF